MPLGVLTEGSIEVCNKDVKKANMCFVARVSSESMQRNIMVRMSWESDPLLHYEMTVRQVVLNIISFSSFHPFVFIMFLAQVIRRGNMFKKRKNTELDTDEEDMNGNGELDLVAVFGDEDKMMAMVTGMEEEGWGADDGYMVDEDDG